MNAERRASAEAHALMCACWCMVSSNIAPQCDISDQKAQGFNGPQASRLSLSDDGIGVPDGLQCMVVSLSECVVSSGGLLHSNVFGLALAFSSFCERGRRRSFMPYSSGAVRLLESKPARNFKTFDLKRV